MIDPNSIQWSDHRKVWFAMIRIENNRIVGQISVNRGFLNGSKDQGGYQVLVKLDGTPIETLVKHALNDAVIILRKRIKTREQAEALENGITFIDMVSAQAKDPDTIAATLDVDQISKEVMEDLIKRYQTRKLKNLETGEDVD
jgi:hypothetical protein